MDKLQQEIMEYIKDYMNKTLSEGCKCLYFVDNWEEVVWDINNWNYDGEMVKYSNYDRDDFWYDRYFVSKILGHYDITAVLKYISDSDNSFWIKIVTWNNDYIEVNTMRWTVIIPHKPLHLYNEQENKDLLELFNKLWKK